MEMKLSPWKKKHCLLSLMSALGGFLMSHSKISTYTSKHHNTRTNTFLPSCRKESKLFIDIKLKVLN